MSDDYWWDQRYAAMFYAVHGCNPGETLRIMVTGSRWFADPPALYGAMDAAATGLTPVVVHGKCNPRHPDTREVVPWRIALVMPPWRKASLLGADWHAHMHAQARGWAEEPHPADWGTHGRKAGFVRNADMVARGAHKCIAALQPGEECKGTRMCADLAAKAFIPVTWVPAPPDDFAGHNA